MKRKKSSIGKLAIAGIVTCLLAKLISYFHIPKISGIVFSAGIVMMLPLIFWKLYGIWEISSRKKQEEEALKKQLLLSPQEEIIKQYHCTEMISPKCDGYLSVTNRRVIFHGYAKDSRFVQELKVDNVAGLSVFYGRVYLKVVIAIAIGLLAYAGYTLFSGNRDFATIVWHLGRKLDVDLMWIWVAKYRIDVIAAVIFAGALLYFFSWRQTFVMQIFSSQAASAPIALGEGYGNARGKGAIQTLTGYPTAETDLMMRELGVMVQDIQTYHDEAIAMWNNEKKRAKKMREEREEMKRAEALRSQEA
jgi:hypothetical protein